MVNVDSGKLKLSLLVILLLVGLCLFVVRNIYTSQGTINQEEAVKMELRSNSFDNHQVKN
jgi:hypothetical protein